MKNILGTITGISGNMIMGHRGVTGNDEDLVHIGANQVEAEHPV